MQPSEYKAVLLQAMQEATDTKQRGELMVELVGAISVMLAASVFYYRGDAGMLLEGIRAACDDIREATANAYAAIEIQKRDGARGH